MAKTHLEKVIQFCKDGIRSAEGSMSYESMGGGIRLEGECDAYRQVIEYCQSFHVSDNHKKEN